jgi:lysozyme family protein
VRKNQAVLPVVVGLLFVLMTYLPVWSQEQVVMVWFEDLGFGSASSFVFTFNSATGEPIGYRTTHIPQIPQGTTNTFVWSYDGVSILTLQFLTATDTIAITGYDQSIDVLFFNRQSGQYYWAGCFSPYIPVGIPPEFAGYFCQRLGLPLSAADEIRSRFNLEEEGGSK